MSVRIFYGDSDYVDFCEETPVQKQLAGATCVSISTEDDGGRSALCFLDKLKTVTQLNIMPPLKMNIKRTDSVRDARLAKDFKALAKKMLMIWTMQRVVYGQAKLDKKFENLIESVKDAERKHA